MELEVKNKRLKISPSGVITLPVAARKSLGMEVNKASEVSIRVDDKCVILSRKYSKKDKTWRISKKGMMTLRAEAKTLLQGGKTRHYWLNLDDKNKQVKLMPY
ncbi:hypothetical protein [Aquimarina celericrescens]|uniref:SpoVT-AbrB domain-containing protein n=1 Tax=Aquimarina celericrescens TaxID=1964542 RepID=A0ABW5AY72_9FLAO|nr:AbrB/MazE/SpoVT family DNA-binding domain-containing protein [Aquimarina celericrescens]